MHLFDNYVKRESITLILVWLIFATSILNMPFVSCASRLSIQHPQFVIKPYIHP